MKLAERIMGGLQVLLAAYALWVLYDTKASSEHFSREYSGQSLEFTWAGILTPILVTFAIGFGVALRGRPGRLMPSRLAARSPLLPVALVVSWWLVLMTASQVGWAREAGRRTALDWFFVQSGTLQPNEIFGASWPLFNVVALLSLAAFLGIFSVVVNWRSTVGSMSAT